MRDIALLMIVCAVLPMAFVRPIVGLMLWIWFSYMNPHRITWGFAVDQPWVMAIALITLFSLLMHARQRQAMHMTWVTALLIAFVGWTLLSTVFAVSPEISETYFIRFFKIVLMAFVTIILVTDAVRLRWVMWTIVLSFGFWGLKGGVFTLLTGGSFHVLGPPDSFFRDNNDFALVMCMTLPLMRYLQLTEPNQNVRRGLWVLMGFTVFSVVGTYSRGGFLALSVVGFLIMLKSRQRAGLLITAPMLLVGIGMFMPQQYYSRINTIDNYEEDKSVQGRFDSWQFATNVALADPLTGGGFRVYLSKRMWDLYGREGATNRAVHSIYFTVLGEHGFAGLALFLSLGIVGWKSLSRIRQQARAGPELYWMGDLASMMQVSIAGYAAAGAFLPMAYFDLFYQLLAITVVLQLFMVRALKEMPARDKASREKELASPAAAPPPGARPRARPNPDPAAARGRGRARPRPQAAPSKTQSPNGSGMRDLPWW